MEALLIKPLKKAWTLKQLVRFPHYETVFKYIFFVTLIITLSFIPDLLQFKRYVSEYQIKHIQLSDVKWLFVGLVIIHILKEINNRIFFNYVYSRLNERYKGEDRILRAKKVTKWFFDVVYYTTATVLTYIIFQKETWFPAELGGYNFKSIFGDWPSNPENDWIPIFYMIQASSHVHALLLLMIHGTKIELKYWEYLLHHSLAVFLILFSSVYNCVTHGVMVLITHDISDIFLALGRAYGDVCKTNKYLVSFLAGCVFVSWFYTRIYVFPLKIWECIVAQEYYSQLEIWPILKGAFYSQIGLMLVLFTMHIYWTIYMVKVNMSIFKSGSYKNVYDNRENKIDHTKEQ